MSAGGWVLDTASSATAPGARPAARSATAMRDFTACKFCAIDPILCPLVLRGIVMDLTELLAFVVKNKASDLHLSSGLPPMVRVHGDVKRINVPALEHKDVHGMIYDIMNDGQRKFYEENLECDFSFAVPNLARFRVNAFVQQRGAAAVLRTIPTKVLSQKRARLGTAKEK